MVNFRYHLVSLIAVFLALGLGILTGSAVVNQATVRTIRNEIRDVRAEVTDLRDENSRLDDELGRSNSFLADASLFTVDGRLAGVPVALLAERDVDEDAVDATLTLLQAAGADAPAVVWLESRWKLESENDVQALRDATGLLGGANSVRERALEQLTQELTVPSTATEPLDVPADLLPRLADAGFITIDGEGVDLTTFPPSSARALLVTGTDSTFAGTDFTTELTTALVDTGAPTVVGEVFVARDGEPSQRGETVAAVRDDDVLSAAVSTVDDLDLVQGRVVAVLALDDLGDGTVGHYGYGAGAQANLPASQQSEQQ